MKIGPAGAFGLWNGSVLNHALKAGRYSGRNRRWNNTASASFPWTFVLVPEAEGRRVVEPLLPADRGGPVRFGAVFVRQAVEVGLTPVELPRLVAAPRRRDRDDGEEDSLHDLDPALMSVDVLVLGHVPDLGW